MNLYVFHFTNVANNLPENDIFSSAPILADFIIACRSSSVNVSPNCCIVLLHRLYCCENGGFDRNVLIVNGLHWKHENL